MVIVEMHGSDVGSGGNGETDQPTDRPTSISACMRSHAYKHTPTHTHKGREVVFPTHKPRDALHGLKSCLYNIGSGAGAGLTALVTAPVVGARANGAHTHRDTRAHTRARARMDTHLPNHR